MSEATPLATRMGMVQRGQATWPEPKMGETCNQCFWFTLDPEDTHRKNLPPNKGICTLNYELGQMKPPPYRGTATACPKFKPPKGEDKCEPSQPTL